MAVPRRERIQALRLLAEGRHESVRAAGGDLSRVEDVLVLSLPLLTDTRTLPSPADAPDRATG